MDSISSSPSAPVTESPLALVVNQSGLELETAQRLMASFKPFFDQAEEWRQKVATVNVTDISQVRDMQIARASRLALRGIRVDVDKMRKKLKEDSLRRSRAIDGMANVVIFLIEPLEQRLLEQEQFAERKEQERKNALKAHREELLAPYSVDTSAYLLGEMSEETFQSLLTGHQGAHAQKIEAARKAEADRIKAENDRLAEEARIRTENARLKAQADERREADRIAKEKADADAVIEADRKAKLKIEREGLLAPYQVQTAFIDLGGMEQVAFDGLLNDSKVAFENHQRVAAEAEEARKRRETALAEERRIADERLAAERTERERVEAEAKKAEAALAEERATNAAAESKRQQDEKAAKDKADADLKAQKDAADAAEAERKKAAAAPDKEKLEAFRMSILGIPVVDMATLEGKKIAAEFFEQQGKFGAWMTKKIGTL